MELIEQFKVLQNEYQRHPYPSLHERRSLLLALKKSLQNQAYSLAEAINKDFTHRSLQETLFLEIFPTIRAITYCLKHMKQWMKNRKRQVSWLLAPAKAYLSPQPLGVVGNMVPWNYPVYLALVPATMNSHYFKRLFMGKLFNAAQTCIAPDYLFIPMGWEEKIITEFKSFIDNYYPQLMSNDNYSAIISESHKQRLLRLVEDARNKEGRVVSFGELRSQTNKMPIYLIFGVTEDMLMIFLLAVWVIVEWVNIMVKKVLIPFQN